MKVGDKFPTIFQVARQIGGGVVPRKADSIVRDGAALRYNKGKVDDDIFGPSRSYRVYTRDRSKGLEWKFFKRFNDESRLVKQFETEIDNVCGEGVGKMLTRSVGAYNRPIYPKLDANQVEKLHQRFEQVRAAGQPPKGFKAEFDQENKLKWVGRFETDC
jgi:hypothetical protein